MNLAKLAHDVGLTDPVPFHVWKERQIQADSRPGCRVYREREWYWSAYGRYCQRVRALFTPNVAGG